MDLLQQLKRLWAHCEWADEALFTALEPHPNLDAAWREYAHILAAEEIWLARLEHRAATVPVWPKLPGPEADELRRRVLGGYSAYLDRLREPSLSETVSYMNSAGMTFATPIVDILLHVLLHGQYHRGKVNLMLRDSDHSPAPVDYIGFVRGTPAAVTPVDR